MAWAALAVLVVGLPLAAWWIGGWRFWGRATPGSERDVYREMVRRHALRPAEAAQVEGAVTWGRELQDPRLRAAVVDWAQALQAEARERSARHPWVRRVALPVLVVAGVLAVAGLVHEVLTEGWAALADHAWTVLWVLVVGWLAPRPRRAIARNSGPPSR